MKGEIEVLMYGWEYPPYISGGLGVACCAIVEALAKKNVKINLILPYDASLLSKLNKKVQIIGTEILNKFIDADFYTKYANVHKIASSLHPYLNTQDYNCLFNDVISKGGITWLIDHDTFGRNGSELALHPLALTGQYGKSLFSEVLNYAEIAGKIGATLPHTVIHAHDWMTILAGIKAKNISNRPLIFHVHALETDRSDINNVNREIFAIEKYGMQMADQVVTVSNYTKNQIVKHYGIASGKITAIHNGIDSDYVKSTDVQTAKLPSKTIMFLGRITHQKGPYFFIEIAKKILTKRPDTQFVLGGTGNQLTEMIEKVASLRIGKNVHFTGFLNPDEVKQLYRLADVYVMPSVSEPFGLSCLEALAHNVPVVISKQSGVGEALQNTLQADFWDIDEMAGKILALIDYKFLTTELLSNVKREMRNLTWDRAANEIIKVYQKY